MVHEDINKAGLGLPSLARDYGHAISKHLVHALNDEGTLGLVTWKLLVLQDKTIGVTLQQSANKKYLRQTNHYHLARQLAIMRTSNVELKLPEGLPALKGNALTKLLSSIRYDPKDLGLACSIPAEVYRPLLELTDNIAGLCTSRRMKSEVKIIDTKDLRQRFGSKVKKEHKIALNQLTKILNRNHCSEDMVMGPTFARADPLPSGDRLVKDTKLLEELASHSAPQTSQAGLRDAESRVLAQFLRKQSKPADQEEDKSDKRSEQQRSTSCPTDPPARATQSDEERIAFAALASQHASKPWRRIEKRSRADEDTDMMGLTDRQHDLNPTPKPTSKLKTSSKRKRAGGPKRQPDHVARHTVSSSQEAKDALWTEYCTRHERAARRAHGKRGNQQLDTAGREDSHTNQDASRPNTGGIHARPAAMDRQKLTSAHKVDADLIQRDFSAYIQQAKSAKSQTSENCAKEPPKSKELLPGLALNQW
ncbi:MAG: hypothetical protein Q9179_007981 [Wetmoreana sp. 5 TL-2023]